MTPTTTIYKICDAGAWTAASKDGVFPGAGDDLRDGFIHFSTAGQLEETARRHFAGKPDLVLIAVDAAALGAALKWEPSRGGALFPHLYGPLPMTAVLWQQPVPPGDDGVPLMPELAR